LISQLHNEQDKSQNTIQKVKDSERSYKLFLAKIMKVAGHE